MSQLSGRDVAACESFLAAFTSVVREGLNEYDEVNVPDFGRFSLQGADNKIAFQPTRQMAADVNAPFEMFAPETLAPEVADEDLAAVDAATAKSLVEGIPVPKPWVDDEEAEAEAEAPASQESQATSEAAAVVEVAPAVEEPEQAQEQNADALPDADAPQGAEAPQGDEIAEVQQPETEEAAVQAPEPIQEPASAPIPTPKAEYVEEPKAAAYQAAPEYEEETEEEAEPVKVKASKFWMVWALIIGFLLGLAVGFFVHDPIQEALEPSLSDEYDSEALEDELNELAAAFEEQAPANEETAAAEAPEQAPASATQTKQETPKATAPAKTDAAPKTEANAKTVYDSVRSGYYLTSMAKKHYGYDKYWVYIYLENKDKISNPNRISTSTKLVIPPLQKYAPGGDTPENRAAAAKKEAEINRRFK